MNLKIKSLGGHVQGFDINWQGWTGNRLKYNPSEWLDDGYEGVHFYGSGMNNTYIHPEGESTILLTQGTYLMRLNAKMRGLARKALEDS